MASKDVATFALEAGAATRVASDDSLAAASRRLPSGVYTTFRTYGGDGVFRFPAHIERLRESTTLRGDGAEVDGSALRHLVASALRRTGHAESRVRLTVAPSGAFASVQAFSPRPASDYRDGVSCVTLPLRRTRPRAKDTGFIATAQGAYQALPPGVEEGLLVDDEGSILEGLTSNFFAVIRGRLHTEEERVLAGITRGLVLAVADARLPRGGQAARQGQIDEIEEAFITSASREVLPVVRIDGQVIGDGRVGDETRGIMEDFAERRRRETERLFETEG